MSTPNPTWRKVAWIASAVVAVGVLGGAVALALEAQSEDPIPELHASAKRRPVRHKRSTLRGRLRGAKLDLSHPAARPSTVRFPKARPVVPKAAALSRASRLRHGPSLGRHPLSPIRALRTRPSYSHGPASGRLSPEELAKRRQERRARQLERLRKRIETLDSRIQSYRQEGTRTEAQIKRMERSLERMRTRLARMEEQQNGAK